MYDNGKWDKPKIVLYCQVGKAVDMLDFSINEAIKNSGMLKKDFDIFFICWKTSSEVYEYLKKKNYKFIEMEYDAKKDFLWNLYKGWNLGYEVGYKYADYICPIATDHAFYEGWLKNLFEWAKPNRIVNCKLIEPGTLPSLHTTKDLGLTLPDQFKREAFLSFAKLFYEDKLVNDEKSYGHRLDAMPFIVPKDVWEKFGPMSKTLNKEKITGDTDFFNRCKKGNVEIVKALNSISYHCGGLETRRNDWQVTKQGTNRFKLVIKKIIKGVKK